MTHIINPLQQLIEEIAEKVGVKIDEENYARLERMAQWDLNRIKKLWATGIYKDGRKVLLKILPIDSVTPKEDFIRTETAEKDITDSLTKLGITVSQTIETNFDQQPYWTIRYLIEGEPVGNNFIRPEFDRDDFISFLMTLRDRLNTTTETIDLTLLTNRDFPKKWLQEFNDRSAQVIKHLGEEAERTLRLAIEGTPEVIYEKELLHNDLAPQNILQTNSGFGLIDWGEATLGPRVIDWAMLWSFALDLPNLRRNIVETAIAEVNEQHKDLAKQYFLALAARMVASFAEWSDHYQTHSEEAKQFARVANEAVESLPKAWRNFQELSQSI